MAVRSATALLGALLLGVGVFCTLMVVFEDKDIISNLEYTEYYKAIAGVANALAIMMLIYLTVTSTSRSNTYKWALVTLLVVGYVLEIYFTFIFTDKSYETAAFMTVAANLLFRGYFMMQYFQEPIELPKFNLFSKETTAAVSPPPAATDTASPAQSDIDSYKSSFRSLLDQARSQREDGTLDGKTVSRAWDIIYKGIREGAMTKDKLREAVGELKYSADQSSVNVSALTFGGRKRR
jgi:hypothetical protein